MNYESKKKYPVNMCSGNIAERSNVEKKCLLEWEREWKESSKSFIKYSQPNEYNLVFSFLMGRNGSNGGVEWKNSHLVIPYNEGL
jgi:hypothetical protein